MPTDKDSAERGEERHARITNKEYSQMCLQLHFNYYILFCLLVCYIAIQLMVPQTLREEQSLSEGVL